VAAPRERRGDMLLHWVLLILCTAVVSVSFVLRIPDGEHVVAPMVNRPLPCICTFKRLAGIDCPGCGLTRSFISLAHGDIRSAWSHNPAGPLFFALVLFQVPYRSLQILRLRWGLTELSLGVFANCVLWLLVFALVAQWVVSTAIRIISP
jgi:hypothetical protein